MLYCLLKHFLKSPSNYYSEVGILRIIKYLLKGVKLMPIQIIGKSTLGELGFCQIPSKMGKFFEDQLWAIEQKLPRKKLLMTSMTGYQEVNQTYGAYFPKIRKASLVHETMFNPRAIYYYCNTGEDKFLPGCDFIIFDSASDIVATTFSREAPIIAFESPKGIKALGVILRPSLIKYGDYLFSTIKEALGNNTKVTLVTCNHFEYPEGNIPDLIRELAFKHNMSCVIGADSEKEPECYHRGESGNHVVAMW